MYVKNIISRSRRDITISAECENCKATTTISGYDDEYYHSHVMPTTVCIKCGKCTKDLGDAGIYTEPTYPDHVVM